jgi:hypothetical protein
MHSDGLENDIKISLILLPYRFTHAHISIEFPFGRVVLSPCVSLMCILSDILCPALSVLMAHL